MKKRVLIASLMAAIMLIFSIANAVENERWYWIFSTDKVDLFFDTQTIEYEPHKNTISVWMRYLFTDEYHQVHGSQHEHLKGAREQRVKVIIKTDEKKMYTKEYFLYDDNGTCIDDSVENDTVVVAPGTIAESVYNAVVKYCKENLNKDL